LRVRIDLSYLPTLGAAFLLIFARTGTMLMLLPGLGEANISTRMRLTFALLLAAILLPLHRSAYHIDPARWGPLWCCWLRRCSSARCSASPRD
jgi:flagellar biosynthesis protein FliR